MRPPDAATPPEGGATQGLDQSLELGNEDNRQVESWVARIRPHLAQAAEGIIAAGRELLEAKAALPHGQFGPLLDELGLSRHMANRFMRVAANPVLANGAPVHALPAAVSVLDELTKLPDDELEQAITRGDINPSTTRAEARELTAGPASDVEDIWMADVPPTLDEARRGLEAGLGDKFGLVNRPDFNAELVYIYADGLARRAAARRYLRERVHEEPPAWWRPAPPRDPKRQSPGEYLRSGVELRRLQTWERLVELDAAIFFVWCEEAGIRFEDDGIHFPNRLRYPSDDPLPVDFDEDDEHRAALGHFWMWWLRDDEIKVWHKGHEVVAS